MATTTSKLALQLPADGEPGWGAMLRSNFKLLDDAAVGQNVVKVLTGGSYSLSGQEVWADSFEINGVLTANQTIVIPNNMPPFAIDNLTTGAFALLVKTALGATVSLPHGITMMYANGTNAEIISSPVAAELTNSAATTIAATATKITLGAVAHNSDSGGGGLTPDTGNSRMTVVNSGKYRIVASACVLWVAAIQNFTLMLYKNGAPIASGPISTSYNNAAVASIGQSTVDFIADLVAGDFIELFGIGSLASGSSTIIGKCSLSMELI